MGALLTDNARLEVANGRWPWHLLHLLAKLFRSWHGFKLSPRCLDLVVAIGKARVMHFSRIQVFLLVALLDSLWIRPLPERFINGSGQMTVTSKRLLVLPGRFLGYGQIITSACVRCRFRNRLIQHLENLAHLTQQYALVAATTNLLAQHDLNR